jgi:hypothetical protein
MLNQEKQSSRGPATTLEVSGLFNRCHLWQLARYGPAAVKSLQLL